MINNDEQVEPSTEYQTDDRDKTKTKGQTVWATFLALASLGLMVLLMVAVVVTALVPLLIMLLLVVAVVVTAVASIFILVLTHQILLAFIIFSISLLLALLSTLFLLKTQKWWNVDYDPNEPITLTSLLASPEVDRSSSALKQQAKLKLKSARRFALDTDKPERRAVVSSPTGDFEIRLVSVYLKPLPLATATTQPSNQGGKKGGRGSSSTSPNKPRSKQAKQPLVIEMEVRKAGSQFQLIKTDTSKLPYTLTLEHWNFSILKAWPTSASTLAGFQQHYQVQIVGTKILKEIEV